MIRRRRPVETKVNHDRWLVSYADLVTLLFAFFVVMYSVSQVNETEYRELSETLNAAFKSRVTNQSQTQASDLVSTRELVERVETALAELIEAKAVAVSATDDWVQISVDANVLFASGSAEPSAEAEDIFAQVAELLAPYDNAVEVSGHTDNVPIQNAQFANNWELSAARATSVVQLLSRHGVAPERLAATGYGEFRPVADNTTEEGRAKNRRVVLMVARHQAERPSVDARALPGALDADVGPGPPATSAEPPREPAAAPEKATEVTPAGPNEQKPLVKPVIREDGSLLFTNDPERNRQ